jgi:hypothetical protein
MQTKYKRFQQFWVLFIDTKLIFNLLFILFISDVITVSWLLFVARRMVATSDFDRDKGLSQTIFVSLVTLGKVTGGLVTGGGVTGGVVTGGLFTGGANADSSSEFAS